MQTWRRVDRMYACIVASLALLLPPRAAAGEAHAISSGTWVRIRTRGEVTWDGSGTTHLNGRSVKVAKAASKVEGAVQLVDEKSVILAKADESPIVVPRDAIASLDVRQRASKKGLGVFIGLVAGGAVGYAIGTASSGSGCQGGETGLERLCSLQEVAKTGSGFLGAVGGALVGLAVAPGAQWQKDVRLDGVHLGVGPTRNGGIGLSLTVAF